MAVKSSAALRKTRHTRVRKKVTGTPERPRLAVYRSLKHIYAQIIDDTTGRTLAAAGTTEGDLKSGGNQQGAEAVGKTLGERAKAAGINKVVFDRGGFRYSGRVAKLADGAREAGLEF